MAKERFRILIINPGSTSTKVAVYEDDQPIASEAIRHAHAEIAAFRHIPDQYAFRRDAVLAFLQRNGIKVDTLDAVVGRGGLLRPLASGIYAVNDRMLEELRNPDKERDQVTNLGAPASRPTSWTRYASMRWIRSRASPACPTLSAEASRTCSA
jgi:butyrate kinase